MTTATDNAHRLFLRATLSEDSFGYPDRVSFLSQDIEGWEDILIRSLFDEGKPIVLVDEEASEVLFEPSPRRWPLGMIDHRLGRQRIRVCFRHGTHAYGLNHVTLERGDVETLGLVLQPQPA